MKTTTIIERLVLLGSFLLSVSAVYISYTSGLLVAYNDAAAHLNTARRMIDSLTPGLVQIGSVWLPLLHLAELPFVANDFLWRSGLAGAIVSAISFLIAAFFLYRLTFFVTQKTIASVIAVAVFVTNLNLLYLQTTAMFEPLLMANALGSAYFLTKWAKNHMLSHLVLAAFFTMLATLTRYDGWALFMATSAYVLLASILFKKKGKEGPFVLFLSLAGFGIFLWILYNFLVFSEPLYFANSEYSAAAQQAILAERGQLPTKHNLIVSFITYTLATVVNNGVIVMGMLFIGVMYYLVAWFKDRQLWKLAPTLLLVPYFFNIVSLYLGQSVIWMPMLPPHFDTYFNARYGLLVLPAAAFFIGYLGSRNIFFTALVSIGLVAQVVLFLNPSYVPIMGQKIGIITLQDTVSSVNEQTIKASGYLRNNYKGGLILISTASADAFLYRAGIPLKNYITEGTGHYWRESLDNPAKYATWIVFFTDTTDRVGKKVHTSPILKEKFTLVYKDKTYQIWKRNNN